MLADELDYVVGVDPHRDSHALAVVHVVSGWSSSSRRSSSTTRGALSVSGVSSNAARETVSSPWRRTYRG